MNNIPSSLTPFAWGITDGSAGMRSQVEGVLEALGFPYTLKNCKRKAPWHYLPGWTHYRALNTLSEDSDPLIPPWPDVVITSGRRSAALGLAVKQASGGRSIAVHLTDPRIDPSFFDLVVAMAHDHARGDNVMHSELALHRLTHADLAEEALRWQSVFTPYPRPWIGVLIGGSTHRYRLKPERMQHVVDMLLRLHSITSGSLLITSSRRTGAENITRLHQGFAGRGRTYVYPGEGANPYIGMLALADWLIVSNDSVNMLSEAAYTGKPLYILRLPGHQNTKPARFAEALVKRGIARWLEQGKPLERWEYNAPDLREAVAERIRTLMQYSGFPTKRAQNN